MYNRNPERLQAKQEEARKNPIRARILELFTLDRQRPLAVRELVAELADFEVNLSQVSYHVRVLQDADLLSYSLPRVADGE